MGNNPDNSLVPYTFNKEVWNYINDLPCTSLLIEDYNEKSKRKLIKITDFLGKSVNPISNIPLLYIYDDGTVHKKIILE